MSRTTRSDAIQEAFLDLVKAEGGVVESMTELAGRIPTTESELRLLRGVFEDLGRAGRNVFLVKGVGLINVHVRADPPGWWDILKSVKSDFELLQNHFNSYFILLVGRKDQHVADGYILSDFNSSPLLKPPEVGATKFTIKEKLHVDRDERLLSLSKVSKALLASRKAS